MNMDNKDIENVSLKTILVKYLRHWKLFLAVFILSFFPAFLYLKFYPRTYEFVASILLQDEKETAISGMGMSGTAGLMKSFGLGGGEIGVNVEDEMEILTSNRTFRMMILDLGINVIYSEPYSFYKLYRETPLKITADTAIMANLQDEYLFSVSVSPEQILVKAKSRLGGIKKNFTFSSLPAVIKIGMEEFVLDFKPGDSQKNTYKLNIRILPAGWMAETLSDNFKVEDVSSISNVLVLTCSEHSQQRGLDMMNTLINVYNKDMESYKLQEVYKKKAFIDTRISEILTELDLVEANLKNFKAKNEITLIESDVSLYSELFKDMKVKLTEAEMNAYQIDLLDDFLKKPQNRDKAIPSVFSVDDGEKGVIAQYNKAIVNREKILNSSNESNYTYRQLNTDVEMLRDAVYVMIENARKGIVKTVEELKSQEKELLAKFKSVPEKEHEYVVFMRDREILQGLYLLMLQQREEVINTLSKEHNRARLIEPPYIKKKPLGPRKLFAAIGIMIFTLVFPVCYLLVKELVVSIGEEYKKDKS